ncbi:MAG: radical SAM family heme chaperone HemW [Candidatus Omnitrophica bacterium]|nr:radical SAM family heme chaperone HemW [Candidatus Omnitrophota bacterium]MCF7893477.1 radical SAM family heme chaperone HemW [Candidatus Omnitrophota bacterium]
MENSLYIHIPFCSKRCYYCDFYSTIYQRDLAEALINVFDRQIENFDSVFDTVYIGGGTPTVLTLDLLERLLLKLKSVTREVKEFTVEANPESLDEDKISLFLDHGVDRISIGCQSFSNLKLNFLGRAHSVKQAISSIEKAKKKGFDNISIDLIYGLPIESYKLWQEDFVKATKFPVTHISAYMLTYEKGTCLSRSLEAGKILSLSSDKVALMYKQMIDYFTKSKFFQYEISNFSKKGFKAIHNSRYWENQSYIGLGPSASSYFSGIRRRNISSLPKYIKAVKENTKVWEYSEKLSLVASAKETAALKIRTIEGIEFNWFRQKTGFDFLKLEKEPLAALFNQKLVKWAKGGKKAIKLTRKGFLFADTVSATFL